TKITLYQALLRPSKFEVVLQKCTELGVAAFVPTISERCIISNVGDGNPAKLERWHRIIVEAAEQSNRGKLPTLQPASVFPQAAEQARGFSLVAWEGESERSIRDVVREGLGVGVAGARRPFTVNVFIGPEGGFSAAEVEIARSYGIVPVSLGRRILRAETAAIAATTIILYEAGDLG
ncbi:MAG: RNA methyltransferase, partial [Chloroflexi bacterium]|nr:RNA methyltransferase [Chloroflexota bacterium]